MIRDLVRFGDPRLLAENAEVDASDTELPELLADMIETCHAAPGIGLAAPQIGVNKRVAVVDLSVGADPGALLWSSPVLKPPESKGRRRAALGADVSRRSSGPLACACEPETRSARCGRSRERVCWPVRSVTRLIT
jgi:hypothetical protein